MPSVFDRLYSTETASSAGKRVGHQASSPPAKYQVHAPLHTDSGAAGPTHYHHHHHHMPQQGSPTKSEASTEGACSAAAGVVDFDYGLCSSKKYHPGSAGLDELSSPSPSHSICLHALYHIDSKTTTTTTDITSPSDNDNDDGN
jgi:hypothetical protein